jgi:hypothetical protein
LIGFSRGNDLLSLIRTLFPFILVLEGIPIATLAGMRTRINRALIVTIILGFLSAVSVWYTWSQNHGLTTFRSNKFALGAGWLVFLAIILAMQNDLQIRFGKIIKIFFVLSSSLLLFFTLTRTNIILLVFIFVLNFFFAQKKSLILVNALLSSIILIAFFKFNLFGINSNTSVTTRLFRSLSLFKNGGLSANGLGADQSILERFAQGREALQLWNSSRLTGIVVLPPYQIFDTIFGTVAQYGLFGLVFLMTGLIQLFTSCKKLMLGRTTKSYEIHVFLMLSIPATFIYDWPADKSFWLAFDVLIFIYFSKSNMEFTKRGIYDR